MKLPVLAVCLLAAIAARAQSQPKVDTVYPPAEKLYLDLHQHPELSLHEVETSAKIAARLKDLGYQVTTGVSGTSVVLNIVKPQSDAFYT